MKVGIVAVWIMAVSIVSVGSVAVGIVAMVFPLVAYRQWVSTSSY